MWSSCDALNGILQTVGGKYCYCNAGFYLQEISHKRQLPFTKYILCISPQVWMSKSSSWFLAAPRCTALLVIHLQHLCYTELPVAYSKWQLRTMGLAVWSTLLQKTKRRPSLFVGDCVQSSGTCTCCSLHFLPLKCLIPVIYVQFQSSHWWGKGWHRLICICNSFSPHLVLSG